MSVTTSWRILLTFVVYLLLKQFTQTKKCNSLNFLKHTKYTFSNYGYWHFYMKSDTYLIVIFKVWKMLWKWFFRFQIEFTFPMSNVWNWRWMKRTEKVASLLILLLSNLVILNSFKDFGDGLASSMLLSPTEGLEIKCV